LMSSTAALRRSMLARHLPGEAGLERSCDCISLSFCASAAFKKIELLTSLFVAARNVELTRKKRGIGR